MLPRNHAVLCTKRSAPLISTSSSCRIIKPCALVLVLSFLKSQLNSTLPKTGECSVLGVRNARSASWDSSVKQPFGLSAQFAEKTNRENVSTQSCQTACHGYAHPPKVGHQSGQSPSVHASSVVSALPPVPVFVTGGSRQSVTQQMRRHADSSGHRNTTRASVGLRARGCPDNVCFWMTPLSTTADHAICPPTQRRERRPCCHRQKPGRSAETRRMEELQQCATLRETCSLVLGYVQDPARTSPARAGSRTRPGTTLEKALTRALTGPALSVWRVFICIFTTARPVRTILSGHGCAVLFLDHSR